MATERDLLRSYGPTAATEGHALQVVIEERIRELLVYRRWYRANRWAEWTDLRHADAAELRALVRLMRRARRIAAAAYDPVTLAKAHDWSEAEKREAWGR